MVHKMSTSTSTDIRDRAAWQQVSTWCWSCGPYTICAVPIGGEIRYELWRKSEFRASAPDAQTCREIAAAGGAVV